MNKIYIIILNYNCWQDTIECAESILKSQYQDYQILIVDNESTDNSLNKIESWAKGSNDEIILNTNKLSELSQPPVKKPIDYCLIESYDELLSNHFQNKVLLIKSGYNGGFAYGNNIAIKYIMKQELDAYVWLLNPDMVIQNDTLSNLMKCASKNLGKIIGTVHKKYENPEEYLLYGGWKIIPFLGRVRPILNYETSHEIDFISGGSLCTSVTNFKKIGLLPEEYFLYWEEADWCTKAKRLGLKFVVCEKSICYDKGSTSIDSSSPLAAYLYAYNALFYVKKYHGQTIVISFFLFLKAIKRFLCMDTKGIVILNALYDFYFGKNKYDNSKK